MSKQQTRSLRVPRTARVWSIVLVLLLATMLGAVVSTASNSPVSAAGVADGCLGPVAGQHIYDCARLLTPTEIANLETQADAVERAGAPTVVYLQVRDATAQQTLQDAIDLMNRWNVESHAGAHDGFVMFFNLQPGNLRHGQVALYAGAKHYRNGDLPQSELDRIRVDVMTPLLQNGQTEEGIAAGLQMIAHDLHYGPLPPPPPPPPPAYRRVAVTVGRVPFSLLGLLFAVVVALFFMRARREPPLSSANEEVGGLRDFSEPDKLPPALAGALVKGRVADAHVEATILDFARRGLLVLEPVGKKVSLRLMGNQAATAGLPDYERETWNGLVTLAGGDSETISSKELVHLRRNWRDVKTILRRELTERGWFDPDGAAKRRLPLYISGTVGMVGGVAGIALMLLAQEGWASIGLVLFLGAGIGVYLAGYAIRDTTVEGDIAAAPWRAYRASVMAREYEPNLDTDLPYIVAFEIVGKLSPRLKAASERGYSPSWFHVSAGTYDDGRVSPVVGFYPYWVVFHASAVPASASGGYSGGGAAAGGGGSAGGF